MNVPPVHLVSVLPQGADVVIAGLADSSSKTVVVGLPDATTSDLAKRFGSPLDAVAAQVGGTSKVGTAVAVPGASGLLILVGIGDADTTPDAVRRACAAGIKKALEASGTRSVTVAISLDAHAPEILAAAAEGALLGAYRYTKAGAQEPTATASKIELVGPKDAADAVKVAQETAEAVCLARDWVNTPPNILYPETFADSARAAYKGTKVDIEVLDEKALAKGGFGGITTVGMGSARPPRLVKITWAPRGAKAHLVLVGKGMTFDSGGLNIKPADGMLTMKCDMGGAAAVLAAGRAIAALGVKTKVTVLAGMAENMPSANAYRPSDVLTMHSGKTVENTNSDAEGRLVLADCLSVAGGLSPDLIVDVATLTGACIVALGDKTAGLMASDEDAADTLLDAAESAGEALWHLPITDEVVEHLKSDVADLKSCGPRAGGSLMAAAFLREFVPTGAPWAHLDIAGPAWTEKPYDYVSKGGTGFGVRTLVALARTLAR